jgi:hypothetical protein
MSIVSEVLETQLHLHLDTKHDGKSIRCCYIEFASLTTISTDISTGPVLHIVTYEHVRYEQRENSFIKLTFKNKT